MTEPTPATSPEVLAAGYARCAEITREHGTTYYWGARLLPAASRRHVHAVYTLARLADDIVDLAGPEPGPETAAELDAFEALMEEADQDLYEWIVERTPTPPEFDGEIMQMIKTFRFEAFEARGEDHGG